MNSAHANEMKASTALKSNLTRSPTSDASDSHAGTPQFQKDVTTVRASTAQLTSLRLQAGLNSRQPTVTVSPYTANLLSTNSNPEALQSGKVKIRKYILATLEVLAFVRFNSWFPRKTKEIATAWLWRNVQKTKEPDDLLSRRFVRLRIAALPALHNSHRA